jgi:hypothetical protein
MEIELAWKLPQMYSQKIEALKMTKSLSVDSRFGAFWSRALSEYSGFEADESKISEN